MRIGLWCLVSLVLACGGSSGTTDAGYNNSNDNNTASPAEPTPKATDTGDPAATPTPAPPTDFGADFSIYTARLDSPTNADAIATGAGQFFYASPNITDFSTLLGTVDTCKYTSAAATGGRSPRDAGPVLALNGPTYLELKRVKVNGPLRYEEYSDSLNIVAGGTYDMSWIGGPDVAQGSVSSVVFPEALNVSSPTGPGPLAVDPAGSDIQISWKAATSDMLFLTVGSPGIPLLVCNLTDDGSFTLKANDLGGVPAGAGALTLFRVMRTTGTLPDGLAAQVLTMDVHGFETLTP